MPSATTLATLASAFQCSFMPSALFAVPATANDVGLPGELGIEASAFESMSRGDWPLLALSSAPSEHASDPLTFAPSPALTPELFNESLVGDPMAPVSITVNALRPTVTKTYISALAPEGCELEVDGTLLSDFNHNISFESTFADCGDQPNVTVGILKIGNDVYYIRPRLETAAETLRDIVERPCINFGGYGADGLAPPRLVGMRVFENAASCTVEPTLSPTRTPTFAPTTGSIELPSARSPWLNMLPKAGGAAAVVVALAVCSCAIQRRLQARQVRAAEDDASGIEMSVMVVGRGSGSEVASESASGGN